MGNYVMGFLMKIFLSYAIEKFVFKILQIKINYTYLGILKS